MESSFVKMDSINKLKVELINLNDPLYEQKVHILKCAVGKILEKLPNAFTFVPFIKVYIKSKGNMELETCWKASRENIHPALRLKDNIFEKNEFMDWVANQVYDNERLSTLSPLRWVSELKGSYSIFKVTAKAVALVVHKLGHIVHRYDSNVILHKAFSEDYLLTAQIIPSSIAMQVSIHCLGKNFKEFVAEVFTGLVFGKIYSEDVLTLYKKYHGPRVYGPNWTEIH